MGSDKTERHMRRVLEFPVGWMSGKEKEKVERELCGGLNTFYDGQACGDPNPRLGVDLLHTMAEKC